MVMRFMFAAAGAALILASVPAAAQGADEDVRCLLASNLFTKAEKDPTKREIAVLSSYFYLGRVDGRLSGAQLGAAMKAQAPTITPDRAGAIMTACAKRMQGAGLAIRTLGKQLGAK